MGVVTNVGPAHVAMFGSREAIARAKGELVEALPADGTAVLNADDAVVAAFAERTMARVLTYGMRAEADVAAAEVSLDADARASFTLAFGRRGSPGRARRSRRAHGLERARRGRRPDSPSGSRPPSAPSR